MDKQSTWIGSATRLIGARVMVFGALLVSADATIVSAQSVGRALETMFGSRKVTTYIKNGQEYDVILQTDRERLTALVLLGLKDRDTFPLLFVRENCADMAVRGQGVGADQEKFNLSGVEFC